MTEWFDTFFDEDYLDRYANALPAERTAAEVDGIVALLGLDGGARILDLACGHGRHAIPLAERGYVVTGFDLSAVFLEHASRAAAGRGVEATFVEGDMRELAFDAAFDAVINIFTAFAYFDDPADDVRVLERVRDALRPGGKLLLEFLNRDGLIGRFRPNHFERTPDGSTVLHETAWDPATDVLDDEITVIRADGTRTRLRTRVRLRTLAGFLDLLRTAGLEPEAWYGGLDGSPYELTSRRIALLARRPS